MRFSIVSNSRVSSPGRNSFEKALDIFLDARFVTRHCRGKRCLSQICEDLVHPLWNTPCAGSRPDLKMDQLCCERRREGDRRLLTST